MAEVTRKRGGEMMVKDRGTWTITESGLAVIGKFPDPAELMREAVRPYGKWKSAQPAKR
jgi:hypothetical protein